MAMRRLIEALGGKILPARGKPFPVAARQQGPMYYIAGIDARGSARAIRRHLQTRRTFTAPHDLEVRFDERSAVVTIAGTVADERTRALILEAAGSIHGVAGIDDRMTTA